MIIIKAKFMEKIYHSKINLLINPILNLQERVDFIVQLNYLPHVFNKIIKKLEELTHLTIVQET